MLTGRRLSQTFCGGHRRLVAMALLAVAAAGCKTGSWGSKPSWWSFGGTTPNESLASAPSFDAPVAKPSETAKPYPTTETPEAYVLSDTTRTDPAAGASASPAGVVEASSVTYGTTKPTPPPSRPAPTATAGTAAPATVAPQVGPYASLSPQQAAPAAAMPSPQAAPADPAAAATAGLAAAPAFNQQPAGPSQASRYSSVPPAAAEPRGSDRWASATPPTSAPAAPPAGSTSRYSEHSSRFSGGYQPASSESAATEPAAFGGLPATQPAEPAGFRGAAPAADAGAGATQPSIDPAGSPAGPSTPAERVLPGSLSPPKRRPDPGYRPGGTSSYRPNRAILAADPAAEGDIIPAAFEGPPSGPADGL